MNIFSIFRFIRILWPWFNKRTDECWSPNAWFGWSPRSDYNFICRAWLVATGRVQIRDVPLPVLNNKVDAPCDGCGGRCCTCPKGEGGFNAVCVYAYEEFATRARRLLTPDMHRPGDWLMKFEERCPMLTEDGKCNAYEYRPLACRQFNCVNGLSDHNSHTLEGRLLYWSPEVRDRLLRLGFKPVNQETLIC